MKTNRIISLLLLLSFSVYVGHSLIPHHHHDEVANLAAKGACPVEHEDHCNTRGQAAHCHAFNNIEFVKHGQFNTQRHVLVITVLLSPASLVKKDEPDVNVFQRQTETRKPDKTLNYFGAIPMRAPPISA